MRKVIGRECKFVFHLPIRHNRSVDTHVVKEAVHYDDGAIEDNLRIVENFKRPFWVTKEHYRKHDQKKEAESTSNLNKHYATESGLPEAIAARLGNRYNGVRDLRTLRDSPYLYGVDVSSKTYIKHAYSSKWPGLVSPFKVATFDIETDTIKDEIIIISISMNDKIHTVINLGLLEAKLYSKGDSKRTGADAERKLRTMYKNYIPMISEAVVAGKIPAGITGIMSLSKDKLVTIMSSSYDSSSDTTTMKLVTGGDYLYTNDDEYSYVAKDVTIDFKTPKIVSVKHISIGSNIDITYDIVDGELECIKRVLAKAHEWGPDFIAIWNIDYDIPKILDVLDKYHVDPKDIFCDPSLPESLRHFKYKEGIKQKMTDSGKHKPVNPEEQWHVIDCPAKFYWIDAMSSHRYIRVGGKTVSGGYSLNNILKSELGDQLGKLKFDDPKTNSLLGIEWHMYMVANKPLEYIIYNQWDNLSMLVLDEQTKDLTEVLPMLAGVSSFDIFNSGPKRIVDAIHFFYLEHGQVLAAKPGRITEEENLGLGSWIVLLPSYRIKDEGVSLFGNKDMLSNIRGFVYDSDQVSGYPSNTQAANVSYDTTVRELLSIEGMTLEDFRLHNINLFFGKVNAIEYGVKMFGFPTLTAVGEYLDAQ